MLTGFAQYDLAQVSPCLLENSKQGVRLNSVVK